MSLRVILENDKGSSLALIAKTYYKAIKRKNKSLINFIESMNGFEIVKIFINFEFFDQFADKQIFWMYNLLLAEYENLNREQMEDKISDYKVFTLEFTSDDDKTCVERSLAKEHKIRQVRKTIFKFVGTNWKRCEHLSLKEYFKDKVFVIIK